MRRTRRAHQPAKRGKISSAKELGLAILKIEWLFDALMQDIAPNKNKGHHTKSYFDPPPVTVV